MKRLMTLLLAAGLVFSATTSAQAIDFKAKGQWLMGFGVGDGSFVNKTRDSSSASKQKANNNDKFTAAQRVRLQIDAVASENLSGTVYFEIGDTTWGNAESGGALGADQTIVEVKNAYIDWAIPETDLKVRMGIQAIAMPAAAGGSGILDDDLAAVVVNYQFNENIGLNVMWARPYNDNYTAASNDTSGNNKANYLDNLDLISVALPMTFDGFTATPWIMYGIVGQNAVRGSNSAYNSPFLASYTDKRWHDGEDDATFDRNGSANTGAFWFGVPMTFTMMDPLNIEFDFNYGYLASQGRGDITKSNGDLKRFDTKREGWLAKALVEYKMDWGTPGIFGWYASGDDSNPKNGSERMPSISACGTFTSFMGDGNMGWAADGSVYDRNLAYAGTWGIGLQVKDMSFVENLSHTFRVAYWGGTNSPSMAKYAATPWSWASSAEGYSGDCDLYLTTNDSLLEFNLVNEYQMYENFAINLELGYVVNFMDQDTWKKADSGINGGATYEKKDAWKAQLIFAYSF
ncbi:MAG: outer membrane homotrimeric porin [Desulfovibrionaceae bacterium]|nr:outer membrane homotrimeric porin [Desulfovibrionaceae bacterium]